MKKTAEHVLEDSVTLTPPAQPIPQPKAPEMLARAAALLHERGKNYDKPEGERSMARTVAAFNAITGRDLSEAEGWLFMQQLKDARNFSRKKPHQDSLEDCIAYSALKAEAEMHRLHEWEDQQ